MMCEMNLDYFLRETFSNFYCNPNQNPKYYYPLCASLLMLDVDVLMHKASPIEMIKCIPSSSFWISKICSAASGRLSIIVDSRYELTNTTDSRVSSIQSIIERTANQSTILRPDSFSMQDQRTFEKFWEILQNDYEVFEDIIMASEIGLSHTEKNDPNKYFIFQDLAKKREQDVKTAYFVGFLQDYSIRTIGNIQRSITYPAKRLSDKIMIDSIHKVMDDFRSYGFYNHHLYRTLNNLKYTIPDNYSVVYDFIIQTVDTFLSQEENYVESSFYDVQVAIERSIKASHSKSHSFETQLQQYIQQENKQSILLQSLRNTLNDDLLSIGIKFLLMIINIPGGKEFFRTIIIDKLKQKEYSKERFLSLNLLLERMSFIPESRVSSLRYEKHYKFKYFYNSLEDVFV